MDVLPDVYDVSSYSELCSAFQDILLAESYGKGLTVEMQNPLNRKFGITHSVKLTGKPPVNPFAPPPTPSPDAPSHRAYSVGSYLLLSKATQLSASHCVSSGATVFTLSHRWNRSLKTRLNSFVSPTSKLVGATTTYKGNDYTADVRLANGPLVAASYLQRINDNWSGGGEGFYSHENLTTWCNNAQSVIGGGRTRPFAYSMALSYAADLTKFVWLYDRTQSNCHRFHVYARHDVTENTALVAKLIASFPTYGSLVSVGYRLKFPRTKSEMLGVVDSYGNVKGIFERRLLTNTRLGVSISCNPLKDGSENKVGVQLSMGFFPKKQVSNSPCLLHETIFQC